MIWTAVARSDMGTNHQEQGLPCQDYGNFCLFNDVMVGAVADGAGSAKHSDVGAQLAVEGVLGYLGGIVQYSQPLSEQEARKLFTQTLKKVLRSLHRQAAKDGYAVSELACTLLVFIATPDWLTAMQIGDGFIVVRSPESVPQLLFQPDKGEFANETTFITSENALEEMQVQVFPHQQEFICAATDGLERVAIRLSDWTPFSPFFQPLEECLREPTSQQEKDEYIQNFLASERLNRRTSDDKTLLLCLNSISCESISCEQI